MAFDLQFVDSIGVVGILNANPYFETDVSNWTPTGGTFVRSTAQFHEGVASGLLTPDGVTATVRVECAAASGAVAGQSYSASAWVRCAVARDVQITINWFDAGGIYLSTSSATPVAVAANTWTLLQFVAVAPATTGMVSMNVQMTGTPLASHLLYVDEATLSGTASLRLDLNDDLPWRTLGEGTEFGTPPLRRAVVSTLMQDGEHIPAAAYGNRMLTLTLDCQLPATDFDGAATAFQNLSRELDRPTNFLRYRPGTTQPVFFRTMRSDITSVVWDAVQRRASVSVLAEPFAFGLRETLPAVTVYNDPAHPSPPLNANPFFETDVSNWTPTGGTFVRSTAQFHEGVASGLLTPDGVTANVQVEAGNQAVTALASYRASAWVRCAVARTIDIGIFWYTGGNVFISTTAAPVAVAANTWTLLDGTFTAPATAGFGRLMVRMTGTPPITDLLYVDEAKLGVIGYSDANGLYCDVSGVKGDVETPLRIIVPQSGSLVAADQMSLLAVRRRGIPGQAPFALQAESMTQGTDTTTQAAAEDASGPSPAWSRTTFATVPTTAATRLSVGTYPTGDTPDVRGRYRVFARIRTTNPADVIYAQLRWGLSIISAGNLEVSVGWDGAAGYNGWKFADFGLISFPAGADPGVDGLTGLPLNARGQTITVEARRQTGSGNLDWDYLLFVPADDRLAIIDWGDIALAGGSAVIDGTTETIYPVNASGVVYGGGTPPTVTAWPAVSPGVTNRLYWLRSVGPLGADTVSSTTALTIEYSPRYLYVRPAAT